MSKRIVCPGCSCLCDGLTVLNPGGIPEEVQTCDVGTAWFRRRLNATHGETDFESRCEQVAASLANAKFPLITGLENLTTQAQQAAVKVADRFNAGIDSGFNNLSRGSMQSFQRYGKVTSTLGEITTRSDLVVFWFCDPQQTHPRFVQRFLRCENATPKRIVVIDQQPTETAKLADEFIRLNSGEALQYARNLRQQLPGDASTSCENSGLVDALVAATYGAVFLGKPADADPAFDATTDQWFQLVRSLNDRTRFVMGSLPAGRNAVGANHVLTSLCGFPDAIRSTEAGPIHNGLEHSTSAILQRRECDMLLVCDVGASQPFDAELDAGTLGWLADVPVVVLSDIPAAEYRADVIHIPVGAAGWSADGDFVRCDDIPIPMAAINTNHVSAAEFFTALLSRT